MWFKLYLGLCFGKSHYLVLAKLFLVLRSRKITSSLGIYVVLLDCLERGRDS